MGPEARRRLIEAVEQARARAAEAARELERQEDAPRAVETALREAEEALAALRMTLEADG